MPHRQQERRPASHIKAAAAEYPAPHASEGDGSPSLNDAFSPGDADISLSDALGAGAGNPEPEVLGRILSPDGNVIGELLDSPGEELGTLVDGSGSVVGGLVAAPDSREQVEALLATKAAGLGGFSGMAMNLLGPHPARTAGLPAWQVTLLVGFQVLVTLGMAKGGRELIKRAVDQFGEAYKLRDPREEANRQTYSFALLKAMDDTSEYLTLGASLFALQRTTEVLEDLIVLYDKAAIRLLGETLDFTVLKALENSTWVLERAAPLYGIALIANFAIELKNEVVNLTLEEKDTSERLSSVDKLLPAVNSAGTWLIAAAAAVNVTNILGIDVSPLLAFGGISGIAVGLGSQQFLQSLLAGLNLLLTVPFLVGDRVEVRAITGERVVVGIAESLGLFNTIFRTDGGTPVEVPNRQLTNLVIQNMSRTQTTRVLETFRDPRCVLLTVGVQFTVESSRIAGRIPDLVRSLEQFLKRCPGVNDEMPIVCTLKQVENANDVTLQISVYTVPESSTEYDAFVQDLMIGIMQTVENNNCICTKIIPVGI